MKLNLIAYAAIIILILLIAVGVQTHRATRLKAEKEEAISERDQALTFADGKKMETLRYVNSYNQAVIRTRTMEVSLANIQALRNTDRLKFINQLEGLKKNLKNLQETIAIDVVIDRDSIPVKVVTLPCKDSITIFHYQLVDEYNTISAMVLDTPVFEIRVPIRSAVYWQRKGKFLWWRVGGKQWFIESYSPNKLVDVTEQELIKVSKR